MKRSAFTELSIAAATSPASCWPRRRLGLATVPQAALAFHSDMIVREQFRLGDDRRVVGGISFGFPDRDHKVNSYRTSRASIPDTVTFVDD